MRAAIVQLNSTDDLPSNLERTRAATLEAAERGAELVALPENFAFMRREGGAFPCAQGPDGELLAFLSELARESGTWLLGGSFPELIEGDSRVYNTSTVYSPEGQEIARYRKIHLFDVDLGAHSYRESRRFAPGKSGVLAETPFGSIGLSVCYDLRFPELYRGYAVAGAHFIAVPSAFMPQTGKDHWAVLLRARAIESQSFVIAAAQCGQHSPDRASYGHSLIIDPWGRILAEGGDEPAIIEAECDLAELERIRREIPSVANRRLG
ncbi:MAG: carbon-nitrogen hydrolase family protein [Myxococcota bacterium]|nr:carbon-nitrogen hydrolase family protein [Myxococcota bacterium]